MSTRVYSCLLVCIGFAIPVLADPNAVIVNEKYPNLASGILTFAIVGALPGSTLLQSEGVEIRAEQLDAALLKIPQQFQAELKNNLFFLLEQEATKALLLKQAKSERPDLNDKDDETVISMYFEKATSNIKVSEEDISKFYKENEAVFCGTALEKVRGSIEPYVLQEKKQQLVNQLITNFGKDKKIMLSSEWVSKQAELAKDNVLDKSRLNGKATLAVFSAASCCGPDKAKPIVESLQEKFSQKANILYIEAKQQQILAARYKVQSIPTQIIFDKSGKEVFRHSGFYSQVELEKQLEKAGLKL